MKSNFLIILFIILLISLLLISYYGYSNRWSSYSTEGFISFKFDKNPLSGDIVIPTYSPSSRVFKLYDNMFFDNTNGNLIQANGRSAQSGNTQPGSTTVNLADASGTSLSSIIVYNRDSSVASVTINTQLSNGSVTNPASFQSKNSGYGVSFSQFMISSNNNYTTDNYQTLYVAWGKNTFIDVINTSVTPPRTLLGALFSDTQLQGHLVPVPLVGSDDGSINIVPTRFMTDPNDDRINNQSWYGGNRLYQICSFLHYDVANGNTVLKNNQEAGGASVSILNRHFETVIPDTNGGGNQTIPNVDYVVHSAQFDPGSSDPPDSSSDSPKFFIYHVGFGQNTLFVVLKRQNQSNDMFKIVKVARFSKDGYVEPTSNDVAPSTPDISTGKDKKANTYGHEGISQSDWDLLGIDILLADQIDYIQSNYVKKTDMVPPIYPTVLSCPNCSGSEGGVCGNCGGNGGSGTVGAEKEKSKGEKIGSEISSGVNNAVTGVVGLGKDVVGGAVSLGKDTLDLGKQAVVGTVDLGKETVGGAVDLTKQGVSGAASMTERAVGGAVGLGKETVGGAVDLTKQAATGAVNELNYLTTMRGGGGIGGQQGVGGGRVGGTGYGGQAVGYGGAYPSGQQGVPINYNNAGTVPGVDPYSGYGALVNKGDNFMPLTASFSAFGK